MVGVQSLFVALKLVFVLVPLARNAISAIDSKGHSDVARKLSGTHINYASIRIHPVVFCFREYNGRTASWPALAFEVIGNKVRC
jgi:hypothetical protein